MGWYINEVRNTVVITKEIAKELFEHANNGRWEFDDPVTDVDILDCGVAFDDEGQLKLHFNADHMEHMDYVVSVKVQAILKKHKVKGDICFSSSQGDNKGAYWGYRFDGKGGMSHLTAEVAEIRWRVV